MSNEQIPKNWISVKLKEISEGINGYAFKSSSYTIKGIPIIRMGNVVGSEFVNIDAEKTKFIDLKENEMKKMEKFIVRKNDVLMSLTDLSETGDFLGTVAYYNNDSFSLLNQRVLNLKYNKKLVDPKFFFFCLKSPQFRKYITQPVGGSLQKNIGSNFVLDFSFPLPPLAEQKRIVEKLEEAFRLVEMLEEKLEKIGGEINNIKEKIEKFKKSIIHQAFSGQLVPQNSEEGTGQELLQQILTKK